MAASELAFEYLALALEATRGTAVSPPTHYIPLSGTLVPTSEVYRPDETRGMLAEFYRASVVRQAATWTADGGCDPNYGPVLSNMAFKAVSAPTTPTSAVLSRLWTFVPTMTADDVKTATFYYGDPNNQIFQAPFAYANEFHIAADASGTDAATLSMSGGAQFPTKVAAPTLPAQSVGSLLMPVNMQLWMDTSSAIGTTAITGRVISANLDVTKNLNEKYLATGPGGSKSYSRLGVGKWHPESTVVFEFADTAQYDLFAAGTTVKMRVRINGDLIETVAGPLSFYNYVEYDIYGVLEALDWGDLNGTNRTMSLQVIGLYDTTLGSNLAIRWQNTKTAL